MSIFNIFKRKKKSLPVDGKCVPSEKQAKLNRVINTLENGSFMAKVEDDGVYIRLAGDEDEGEAFTLHFANVLPEEG